MAVLTIKNLPDDLYARLKARAQAHNRSLNREAITCLEQALEAPAGPDPSTLLATLAKGRARLGKVWLTDRGLARARAEGRQ